jgi:hypothetical protein
MYSKDASGTTGDWDLLPRLIAEQIRKAVSEDREALREQLPCDVHEPCPLASQPLRTDGARPNGAQALSRSSYLTTFLCSSSTAPQAR